MFILVFRDIQNLFRTSAWAYALNMLTVFFKVNLSLNMLKGFKLLKKSVFSLLLHGTLKSKHVIDAVSTRFCFLSF